LIEGGISLASKEITAADIARLLMAHYPNASRKSAQRVGAQLIRRLQKAIKAGDTVTVIRQGPDGTVELNWLEVRPMLESAGDD
jgi:hypothetical protein